MSILKKLAGHTIIYGSSVILARLINVFFTPFYTNVFPEGEYGIYAQLYAYVAVINVILTFGMETTFFRFIQDSDKPKTVFNQAFFWVLSIASAFALLGGFLSPILAGVMGYEGQGQLILMLVGIVFLDALAALPLAKLRHEEKVKRFSIILLTNVGVTVAANIVLIGFLEPKIEYIFVANLLASTVRLGMALWKNLPSSLKPDWLILKDMIHYAFYIMIAGLAGIMNETLDRIMIPERWSGESLFLGEQKLTALEMNGIYAANYKVAVFILLATQAFRYAVEPFFFKEAKSKDSPENFAKIFHYFSLTTLVGFLILASFSYEIVAFEFFGIPEAMGFGKKTFVNASYWSGIPVIPILLMAYVFSAAYIQMSIWFKITKQTRFALLFTGTGALITILINYFGIPIYGFYASAWATLICYAVMCVMVYFVGQKYYPIPYRVRRILIYGGIFLLGYYFNTMIGPAEGFADAFLIKSFICLLVFGVVFLGEKYLPVFGKAVPVAKDGKAGNNP
ncbi:MAG: oligosaccharide flippase family protein [Bacteroidota bacterium]